MKLDAFGFPIEEDKSYVFVKPQSDHMFYSPYLKPENPRVSDYTQKYKKGEYYLYVSEDQFSSCWHHEGMYFISLLRVRNVHNNNVIFEDAVTKAKVHPTFCPSRLHPYTKEMNNYFKKGLDFNNLKMVDILGQPIDFDDYCFVRYARIKLKNLSISEKELIYVIRDNVVHFNVFKSYPRQNDEKTYYYIDQNLNPSLLFSPSKYEINPIFNTHGEKNFRFNNKVFKAYGYKKLIEEKFMHLLI